MTILSIFTILLAKLSGQEDIVVGTPIAGRRHADLEHIIGMFVNTLPIRHNPAGEKTFKQFLSEVKEHTVEAFENQEYQFEELVEKVSVQRDTGRNPLFDVTFNLLNRENTGNSSREIKNESERTFEHKPGTSKFDLILTAVAGGEGMEKELFFNLEYCTRLFKASTIERFIGYFKKTASVVLENPGVKLAEIEIIAEEEKQQILVEFNNTVTGYPKDKTIHELFIRQVEKTPDPIALVAQSAGREAQGEKGRSALCAMRYAISYRELNEKSHRLAYLLIEKGVKSDTVVAIMVERSIEMIIGILGILKAGGAYLPIDPAYPQERIKYMLTESGANLLVTTHGVFEGKKIGREKDKKNLEIVFIDSFTLPHILTSSLPHFLTSNSTNLSYVIYTSGTTGMPKGVLVIHRNVLRLVKETDYFEFRENHRLLQTGALEFDASTFEIWGSLLNGMTLYLSTNEEILRAEKLKETIRKYDIGTMWLTSPLFNRLSGVEIEIFAGMRNLLVGGDVLSPAHIDKVRERYPGLRIINGYGPTENTTFSTTYSISQEHRDWIPIGTPISNSTAYIVDRGSNLLPVGVAGELLVGGHGVARGYLNNPELTAGRFILAHSSWLIADRREKQGGFESDDDSKELPMSYELSAMSYIYKTGDLACWQADGNIQFLGRRDRQVKIRGYRIEPGEIRAQLLLMKVVKDAAVIDWTDKTGQKHLCAYLVLVPGEKLETAGARSYLARQLPGYMIPGYFIALDNIPLTSNGKVDRERLPLPGTVTRSRSVAPGTGHEKLVAGTWAQVLGLDEVDVETNFFELGGNSLDFVKINSQLKEALNIDIPIAVMFRYPTIRDFAAYLSREKVSRMTDRTREKHQGISRMEKLRNLKKNRGKHD